MSLNDEFDYLAELEPMSWAESASRLASDTCPEDKHDQLGKSLKSLTTLTKMFNHMTTHMDMHNLYITEHIYSVMPQESYKNLINFARNVVTEPVGEDNYMSNYPQYNELRAESEHFVENFEQLPATTQLFFEQALNFTSSIMFASLHSSADFYEDEVTKDIRFDPDF